MNDEATPHYHAIIMQMTEGHEWLQKNLQVKPSSGFVFFSYLYSFISWSIDPFGYSPTHSYINQLNGIRGMLIHRAHYEVKKYLAQRQQLEFMWRQIWADGNYTDMFTHLTPFYSYDIPHTCGPVPKVMLLSMFM